MTEEVYSEEGDEVYYGGDIGNPFRSAARGIARSVGRVGSAAATVGYKDKSQFGRPDETYFQMKNERNLNNETAVNVEVELNEEIDNDIISGIRKLVELDNTVANNDDNNKSTSTNASTNTHAAGTRGRRCRCCPGSTILRTQTTPAAGALCSASRQATGGSTLTSQGSGAGSCCSSRLVARAPR